MATHQSTFVHLCFVAVTLPHYPVSFLGKEIVQVFRRSSSPSCFLLPAIALPASAADFPEFRRCQGFLIVCFLYFLVSFQECSCFVQHLFPFCEFEQQVVVALGFCHLSFDSLGASAPARPPHLTVPLVAFPRAAHRSSQDRRDGATQWE